MDHETSVAENAYEKRKAVIGIRMTIIYSLVYTGFVVLSVFRPGLMGMSVMLGLNLAVVYGLGLIVFAIAFALIYNHLCRFPSANGEEAER